MEKHEFKPKEWVLVRNDDVEKWKLDIFSHFVDGVSFPYICVGSYYDECIPYEGNEGLLGTTDAPEEKKTDGWKVGGKVEVEYDTDKKWYGGEIVRIDLSHRSYVDNEAMPYYVRSECFKYNDGCVWCAARQLRKPKEAKENEEFKFGDRVQCREDGEWMDGLFIMDDHTTIRYLVYLPEENDTIWLREEDVRHA